MRIETYQTEAVVRRCSVKKVFLEISRNSQEITCARVSFLIKKKKFIKKETLAQVFSCKFLRTPFFIEHLRWLLLIRVKLNDNFAKFGIYVITIVLRITFLRNYAIRNNWRVEYAFRKLIFVEGFKRNAKALFKF